MKQIALTGKNGTGQFALVDDEDFEWLNQYNWHLTNEGYVMGAYTEGGNKKKKLMHKLITGYDKTDHKNRIKLDNQRSNLRETTNSQNQANTTKRNKRNSTSKYKGVWKHGKNFTACVTMGYKKHYLGSFLTVEDAAKAADIKSIELFGEFANTNFDKEIYKYELCPDKIRTPESSRYRNLSWDELRNKWRVAFSVNNKTLSLGRFETEKEAIEALQDYHTNLYYEMIDEQTSVPTKQTENNTKNSTKCLNQQTN